MAESEMHNKEITCTSGARSRSRSRLLLLPFELRAAIYEYVLDISRSQKVEIHVSADQHASSDVDHLVLNCSKQPPFHPDLAIFRVSKTIHNEALPVLYRQCVFFPVADADVISLFFGQMSKFARSSIRELHLRPRSRKVIRLVEPHTTVSKLSHGPSWGPTCDEVSELLLDLEDLYVHLHSIYCYQLERGDCIDWIIRPLARLSKVRKILVFADQQANNPHSVLAIKWKTLMQRADYEAAEQIESANRIKKNDQSWPDAYWMSKRHKPL